MSYGDNEWRDDLGVNVSEKIPEVPRQLHVTSTTRQGSRAGTYTQVEGQYANGNPTWKQEGGSNWIYTGTNGQWYITAMNTAFDTSALRAAHTESEETAVSGVPTTLNHNASFTFSTEP